MRKILKWLLALLLFLPALAQEAAVPIWLGDGSLLSPADLESAVGQMLKNQPKPQHIVVLVHGYHTTREESAAQFQEIGKRFQDQYAQRKEPVLVIGLQWESAIAGAGVPWEAEEAYLSMVGRARKVGHNAVRQVLLRVAKQFPKADVSLYGHSLGCEVSTACLLPEINYGDDLEKSTAYLPQQDLSCLLVSLVGSDLDYDIWYKSGVVFRAKKPRARMIYMTISPYLGDRDKTLQIRQMSRGMAGGSAFPRMTVQQCDTVYKNRAILFDNRGIPTDHSYTNYYGDERVGRLVGVASYLANPKKAPEPVELAEADKILKLPNSLDAIVPYLDSELISSQLYALWRVEQINCGSSIHMCDETLGKLAGMLRNTPAKIKKERPNSPCKTVQKAIWPTEKTMTRAGAPNWDD